MLNYFLVFIGVAKPLYLVYHIQDRHDKSVQKEFLSHTLKNKFISLIFFVIQENNIVYLISMVVKYKKLK